MSSISGKSRVAVKGEEKTSVAVNGKEKAGAAVSGVDTESKLREYLKRVTIDLHDSRARLRELEGQAREPIAIVGMSCRYPGGICSAQRLWEVVLDGTDVISDFPTDRGWDLERLYHPDPDHPGTSYVREGGFVYEVPDFDAEFFSISPREALAMDPQQRLLLETTWELFEHAGIDPRTLRKTRTGTFVGGGNMGYGSGISGPLLEDLEGHLSTGNLASVLSGRIAYGFGLEGPALTIDTGCSSSLIALHLACESLRKGECPLALAGGVAIMATPMGFQAFSRQRGLARDGRCKSYADAADGTSWSEGAGMLLLERLSDAQRHGRRIWALVRGSAINQDGASNGLAAPSGRAQQRVVRAALENAGVSAKSIDVVEGHGTGTTLGDPIEAQALLATYGRAHTAERPLWLGSVKSNLGHPQAAGGTAGVIKMVMALQHELLPKTLHVDQPSTQVDWSLGNVSLLTEARDWPAHEEPRRAGVSSFGISGTNAHVILEEAPSSPLHFEETPASSRLHLEGAPTSTPLHSAPERVALIPWVLSAKDTTALRGQAASLLDHLAANQAPRPIDIGFSLATGRAALERRAVSIGGDAEHLSRGLRALADGHYEPSLVCGALSAHGAGLALLFSGQGAQRVGMGRELYRAFPIFREALDRVCGQLDELLGRSLLEVMFGEGERRQSEANELDQTMFTQAALFALEVALFRLVEHWGVKPDFLMGHSIGELAAVHVADGLSLQDACALVAARGQLMGALPGGGAMVALQASEQEALAEIGEYADVLAIAAVNGPSAVVVSGEQQAALELADRWAQSGRKVKRLEVSHAFHSAHMDDMLDQLAEVAGKLSFEEARIPIVSNLDAQPLTVERMRDPRYWADHARQAVRFADGVRWLEAQGIGSFFELGPDAVLSAMAQECLAHEDQAQAHLVTVPALRREGSEVNALIDALAQLWVKGAELEWGALYEGSDARRVQLPTYAFQRRRYWLDSSTSLPTLSDDARANGTETADGTDEQAARKLSEQLRLANTEERRQIVLELVCEQTARIRGYASLEVVDPDRTFKDLGFDSLMAVQLRNRLAAITQLKLPNALAFNYPNASTLAQYLLERMFDERPLDDSPLQAELELSTLAQEMQKASADQVIEFIDTQLGAL